MGNIEPHFFSSSADNFTDISADAQSVHITSYH